jgi:hypothetical protein
MRETDPLKAFFDAGDVASADPAFRLRVVEAVARRRFRLELVTRLAISVLLLAGVALIAPTLGPLAGMVFAQLTGSLGPVMLAFGITAAVAISCYWFVSNPGQFSKAGLF